MSENDEFEIVEDLFEKIESEPDVDITYSIRCIKDSNIQVEVTPKKEPETTFYNIKITVANETTTITKRWSDFEELLIELKQHYGSEEDMGIARDIQTTEKSPMGYHVVPCLHNCQETQDEVKSHTGLQDQQRDQDIINKRVFKIKLFILKIINNSTLSKSSRWKLFMSTSKQQHQNSMLTKVFRVANKVYKKTTDSVKNVLKNEQPMDSLHLTYQNLINIKEQMSAHKEILTICQELVGSNQMTYMSCLKNLEYQVWYMEDLTEQLVSLIEVTEKIKEVEESVKKGRKDDIDIMNIDIYLHNTKLFFKKEKELIEKHMTEDLQFIMDGFKSIVHEMTNVEQKPQ